MTKKPQETAVFLYILPNLPRFIDFFKKFCYNYYRKKDVKA